MCFAPLSSLDPVEALFSVPGIISATSRVVVESRRLCRPKLVLPNIFICIGKCAGMAMATGATTGRSAGVALVVMFYLWGA